MIICSNAESQRQQGNNSKSRTEAEHSDGVSQILANVFDESHEEATDAGEGPRIGAHVSY
jgi:phosphoribosyl-ATP pyrophosphohydrolase